MNVIPPTVVHTLQGSCRAGGSHRMHGGVALPVLAIAIRVPLPDSSPSPSRLRIAAESVTAHLDVVPVVKVLPHAPFRFQRLVPVLFLDEHPHFYRKHSLPRGEMAAFSWWQEATVAAVCARRRPCRTECCPMTTPHFAVRRPSSKRRGTISKPALLLGTLGVCRKQSDGRPC